MAMEFNVSTKNRFSFLDEDSPQEVAKVQAGESADKKVYKKLKPVIRDEALPSKKKDEVDTKPVVAKRNQRGERPTNLEVSFSDSKRNPVADRPSGGGSRGGGGHRRGDDAGSGGHVEGSGFRGGRRSGGERRGGGSFRGGGRPPGGGHDAYREELPKDEPVQVTTDAPGDVVENVDEAKEEVEPDAPPVPEIRHMTLEEFKASAAILTPQFNTRQAGEGADKKVYKKLKPISRDEKLLPDTKKTEANTKPVVVKRNQRGERQMDLEVSFSDPRRNPVADRPSGFPNRGGSRGGGGHRRGDDAGSGGHVEGGGFRGGRRPGGERGGGGSFRGGGRPPGGGRDAYRGGDADRPGTSGASVRGGSSFRGGSTSLRGGASGSGVSQPQLTEPFNIDSLPGDIVDTSGW